MSFPNEDIVYYPSCCVSGLHKEEHEILEKAGWKGPGYYYWDKTGNSCTGPFKLMKIAVSHV